AMRDPPQRFDFRPPHAAMPEADAVLVERLGNDDVLHALGREVTLLGKPGDPAIAARLLVRGGGNLDGAAIVGTHRGEGLRRDNRGRESAFHVAGAATIDLAIPDLAPKRIDGPAAARLHHVVMGV